MPAASRPTTRALLGTMALIVLLIVYVLGAMLLAAAVLPYRSGVADFLFYAFAGLAWVPAAAVIIRWMYPRQDAA